MRGIAAALALLLAAPAAAAPQRVVSINLCADQLLVALAEPGQIAALSPLAADPALSAVAGRVGAIPRIRPGAEAVLAQSPDLVLAGAWGGREAELVLRGRGVAVLRLPLAEDFAAIRAQIRQVGAALGQERRATAVLAEIDAGLSAIAPHPPRSALVWQAGGFTPGRGTLADAVLAAAGLQNAAPFAGYGTIRLERLLAAPPTLLVLPARLQGAGASLSEALLSHPALAAIPVRRIEPAWLACGGPETWRAARALAQ